MRKFVAKILKSLRKILARLARRLRGLLGMPEPACEVDEVEVPDPVGEAAVREAAPPPSHREPSRADLVREAARELLTGRQYIHLLVLHPHECSWLGRLSPADLAIVAGLPEDVLEAHLAGDDVIAGLPPVDRTPSTAVFQFPEPAPDPQLPDLPRSLLKERRSGGGRKRPRPADPAMLSAAEAYDLAAMMELERQFTPGHRPR